MWDWLMENAWVTWVGLATLLAVTELFSLELVLLMFALAALASALVAALGAPGWVTIVIFAVVSVIFLVFIRPRFVKKLHDGPTLTVGHHRLVGHVGVVDEPVSSFAGRVEIDGELWTSRTADSSASFDIGAQVVVVSIEGATAMVAGKES